MFNGQRCIIKEIKNRFSSAKCSGSSPYKVGPEGGLAIRGGYRIYVRGVLE